MPEKKNAILQRGYAYGRSRSVCGYHWQSDVEAGIWVGAATVAALHANPDFHAQLEAARHEIIQKSATSERCARMRCGIPIVRRRSVAVYSVG